MLFISTENISLIYFMYNNFLISSVQRKKGWSLKSKNQLI